MNVNREHTYVVDVFPKSKALPFFSFQPIAPQINNIMDTDFYIILMTTFELQIMSLIVKVFHFHILVLYYVMHMS